MKNRKHNLAYLASGLTVAILWHRPLQAQGMTVTLDPAWRVGAVDTTKPGFLWNYFQSPPGRGNTTERTESDLAGQSRDSTGALLPNIGDPTIVGAAIAAAAPADSVNGLLHFEIESVINLSRTEAGAAGYFPDDLLEPGINTTGGTDGQAAEILTYLTLPAGTITMGIRSDDGVKCESGAEVRDVFRRVKVGERSGGAGELTFSFIVQQAGTYPFRTIWENGGGDSHVEWYSIATDGTKILINDVANGGLPAYRALAASTATPPYVKLVTPAPVPRQMEQSSRSVTLVLADGTNPVDDTSVAFQLDGKSVPLTKQRKGNTLTADTGVMDGLHLPGEAHAGVLTFRDSTGAYTRTQQWTFYNLENLVLPATPVTGENFDAYPEASSEATTVPPGWVATNYTYAETPGWDLADITSEAYMNWVLITTDTVLAVEDEVMDNDKTQLINGQPVANWMSGNLLFVASDGRLRNIPNPNGAGNISVGQIQIVVSAPFNLATVANPVLTFSSGARLSGNKEQMTMEYSIDKGASWLPVIYMRNSTTVLLQPDGAFDAVAMCTEMDTNQIARWPEPGVGPKGGNFGDMIAAPISQALAPYFVNRNDGVAARKVEAIRLPQASRQSDVRLRLTHAGSCGWEWGVDNLAFYDVAPVVTTPPSFKSIQADGTDVVMTWEGGSGPFLVQGTGALGSAWVDLLTTSARTARIPRALPMTFFRIQDGATKTVALFKSVLNGANERPNPVTTPATGIGLLALDGTTASYWVTYSDLKAAATAAHVHGPADANASAGVMFGVTPVGAFGTQGVIAGTATVSAAQAADIAAGKTYFNIHTSAHGGGEIRGQLLAP